MLKNKRPRVLTVVALLLWAPSLWAANNFQTLYDFTGAADGGGPTSLIFDQMGNLYGTTVAGGDQFDFEGNGVVFKLAPNLDGSWTESVLLTFTLANGSFPAASLIFDKEGNLYGVARDIARIFKMTE